MWSFGRSKWHGENGTARPRDPEQTTDPSELKPHAANREVFKEICSSVLDCNLCFKSGSISRGFVKLPQPRYVGEGYWSARERRLFLMINPGSGGGSDHDQALAADLEAYKIKEIDLTELFAQQRRYMDLWRGGRFINFFRKIGVDFNEVAILNLAWCATASNEYPDDMLKTCFDLHGRRAVRALDPSMIVACGDKAQRFAQALGLIFVPAPHYAAREKLDYEAIAKAIGLRGETNTFTRGFEGPKQPDRQDRSGVIRLLRKDNPKSGKSAARYACYRDAMTVSEYEAKVQEQCGAVEAKKCKADIKWDTDHGFIRLSKIGGFALPSKSEATSPYSPAQRPPPSGRGPPPSRGAHRATLWRWSACASGGLCGSTAVPARAATRLRRTKQAPRQASRAHA